MKTGIKTIITGAVLFIVGAFVIPLAVVLPIVIGLSNSDEKQFIIPGDTQTTIEKPGRYYLWNDHQTIFKGKSYNRSESIPDGIEIKITNVETGKLFDFVSDASMSSTSGNSSKNTIGYIEVSSPCTVDIKITGGEEERVFSLSESNLLKMIGIILGGSVLAIILGFAGFGIAVWGIVKLVRSNKKG